MGFPLLPILDVAGRVLDRVLPDTVAKDKFLAEMQMELAKQDFELAQEQIEVNKVEAASSNVFVSGWRPALGWICAIGFAWRFVGYPVGQWIIAVWYPEMTLPVLPDEGLMELTLGMLGLGGLRTIDKIKGTSK